MTVSGVGASTLTSAAGTVVSASAVGVTTTGTGTGAFTNPTHPSFWATPGQSLSLANAMAAGSTSTAASYNTTLTCTNAFTGPGATTVLPTNQSLSSFALDRKSGVEGKSVSVRVVPGGRRIIKTNKTKNKQHTK